MPDAIVFVLSGGALCLAVLLAVYLRERALRKTQAMPAGLQTHISLPHQAEWTLYHNPFSLCSKKIRVCLAEYGVDYQGVFIDLIETGKYQIQEQLQLILITIKVVQLRNHLKIKKQVYLKNM